MQKLIALFLALALSVLTLGPTLANANGGNGHATTTVTRSDGGGAQPVIKAKWEMDGPWEQRDTDEMLTTGDDDDLVTAGAQFNPPGEWKTARNLSYCAVVTDPDGVSDISDVYANVFYPDGTAFHPEGTGANADEPNTTNNDHGLNGCMAQMSDEIRLTQLDKDDGLKLFCDNIRNGNNNLPTFNDDYGPFDGLSPQERYEEICAADGELQKETAYVYCADRDIIWEDPAGSYKARFHAVDEAGLDSEFLVNHFDYLPFLGFETDFDTVDYGSVKLNTHKRISGDKTFDTSGNSDFPSVRNVGNVRAQIGVEQDDMNFGTTDGQWNVRYDARLGNSDQEWKNYDPDQHVWIHDVLDLSEVEELDFSILVKKFPPDTTFSGNMWLDAKQADFRQCISGHDYEQYDYPDEYDDLPEGPSPV